MTGPIVDLDRLLKLRLAVARHGEMDVARWWNTKGMLAPQGAVVLSRGFPRTHRFAQARIVFAVARARCAELFNPPGCMTLWTLPADVEDAFESKWQEWLDEPERWTPVFQRLEAHRGPDLVALLRELELVDDKQVETASKLKRSAEGRSVPLSGTHSPDDNTVTLLAAAFSRGEPGSPAIPYGRLAE